MSKNKSVVASSFISQEVVERKIYLIRGKKVMIDQDLASLYQVPTKVLNQAVKRNLKRFPSDFMFRLNNAEKTEVVTHCDHPPRFRRHSNPRVPPGCAAFSQIL